MDPLLLLEQLQEPTPPVLPFLLGGGIVRVPARMSIVRVCTRMSIVRVCTRMSIVRVCTRMSIVRVCTRMRTNTRMIFTRTSTRMIFTRTQHRKRIHDPIQRGILPLNTHPQLHLLLQHVVRARHMVQLLLQRVHLLLLHAKLLLQLLLL